MEETANLLATGQDLSSGVLQSYRRAVILALTATESFTKAKKALA